MLPDRERIPGMCPALTSSSDGTQNVQIKQLLKKYKYSVKTQNTRIRHKKTLTPEIVVGMRSALFWDFTQCI